MSLRQSPEFIFLGIKVSGAKVVEVLLIRRYLSRYGLGILMDFHKNKELYPPQNLLPALTSADNLADELVTKNLTSSGLFEIDTR